MVLMNWFLGSASNWPFASLGGLFLVARAGWMVKLSAKEKDFSA
jgi:hypothetical protein